MEYTTLAKNVRVGPRKLRLVADFVRGLPAQEALDKLSFLIKSGAEPVTKALKSAIANSKLKQEDLKIKNILINEGIKMKRRDKSHGARFGGGVIHKRTSHIKVILTDEKEIKSQNSKVKNPS
ncbi:50S ribosomal protein L22 [Candidatus Gottesmanbacteria bacterium]|nr:50S ribosomal protein L22 [Candidatus Gottesmanbacteria bacterium]